MINACYKSSLQYMFSPFLSNSSGILFIFIYIYSRLHLLKVYLVSICFHHIYIGVLDKIEKLIWLPPPGFLRFRFKSRKNAQSALTKKNFDVAIENTDENTFENCIENIIRGPF